METTPDATNTNPNKTKKSVSETGHAKNVTNFQVLISFVEAYGPAYNPSKKALQLPQLKALYQASQASLTDVITFNTQYNTKVNERAVAFTDLKPLATRLVNAIQATNATPQAIKDAKGFNRKIQGKRALTQPKPIALDTTAPKTISTSQQSYSQQIQHFEGLIAVLKAETSYTPNEDELKIATLTAKQADLTTKDNQVAIAFTNISNSRISRNNTLYDPESGLVETAAEVKKYVKSLFGASSPNFELIKGIQFKSA